MFLFIYLFARIRGNFPTGKASYKQTNYDLIVPLPLFVGLSEKLA